MALTRSTDPLVWIDCEMTGLDPQTDTIMSISVLITDSLLHPLEPNGLTRYITHSAAQLSRMSEWCVQTHGATGLTALCLDASKSTTASSAAQQVTAYIRSLVPTPRTALLAGNSIHADRGFLCVPPWDTILAHLHYRLFDVSATKEMVRRWASPAVLAAAPVKQLRHSAREDVLESIEEARFYMSLLQSVTTTPASEGGLVVAVPFSDQDPRDVAAARDTDTLGTVDNGAVSNDVHARLPTNSKTASKQEQRQSLQQPAGDGEAGSNSDSGSGIGRAKRPRVASDDGEGFRTDIP